MFVVKLYFFYYTKIEIYHYKSNYLAF